ncbi:anaphase promoting complex subunit doc1 [Agyrium rufum]|nr:anaphase promoting complex subunit doc1 [Agyrium rufum]
MPREPPAPPPIPLADPDTEPPDPMNEDEEVEEEGESGSASEASTSAEDQHLANKALLPSDPTLREISPLASWTVSTYKPGCGVAALLHPSTSQFWQSDGPQPHFLNIHFFKQVSIVKLRIYLDSDLDESYTPTRMVFAAGMQGDSYGLVEFAEWKGEDPSGWVDIGLEGCGGVDEEDYGGMGGDDGGENEDEEVEGGNKMSGGGGVLRCMCLQIRILENHQNGKDTHLRGVQIFARDERVVRKERRLGWKGLMGETKVKNENEMDLQKIGWEKGGLIPADWMGDPEIR